MIKSPFLIYQNFISPLLCEEVIESLNFLVPDTDSDGNPTSMRRTDEKCELILFERFVELIPDIEQWYDIQYKGTEHPQFEWYPAGTSGPIRCENSDYIDKKWVRFRPCDITGILFLSNYQDSPGLDEYSEAYGGKLEFPNHQFGFNPERGTLIIFPSEMHFLNATAEILIGNLYQVRFQIVAQQPYVYDPSKFPGDYTTWFQNL